MYKYLVVFEKTNTGYNAFVPNLPGCVATGPDRHSTEESIYEAIQLHIRGLKEEKEEIPAGTAESEVFVFSSDA